MGPELQTQDRRGEDSGFGRDATFIIYIIRRFRLDTTLGCFYRIWLVNKLYVFGAIISGLGMNLGEIKAGENYSPGFSPGLRLQIKAGCGYVREKYSVSFVSDQSAYALTLENDSAYAYGIGALKLAFSWRFHSENPLHHLLT